MKPTDSVAWGVASVSSMDTWELRAVMPAEPQIPVPTRVLAYLRRLEWSAPPYLIQGGATDGGARCPECEGTRDDRMYDIPAGHERTCALAGLLVALGVEGVVYEPTKAEQDAAHHRRANAWRTEPRRSS